MSYEAIEKETASLSLLEQLNLLTYLANLIKRNGERQSVSAHKKDFSDTYSKGFFELFGSDPNFDLKDPEDIPLSIDGEVSFG